MSQWIGWRAVLLALTLAATSPVFGQEVVEYYHTDALGSIVAVTDQQRNVLERREYEPYGYQLTPALQDGPGYTGHVQDAATGLTYMQQRHYDPSIGRFLSIDPVSPHSGNGGNFSRYAYVNNSPYRFIDPEGLYRCEGSAADCTQIDHYVERISEARNNLPARSTDYARVKTVSDYIGAPDSEGPTIRNETLPEGVTGRADQSGGIILDLDQLTSSIEGARILAHEATHDRDRTRHGTATTSETVRRTETNAYRTDASVGLGLGEKTSPKQIRDAIDTSVKNWEERQKR